MAGFKFRNMTTSSNGNEAGRLVVGCRLTYTSYDKNHLTILLPMSAKDPDTGDFTPFKEGVGDDADFGQCMVPFQAVQFAFNNNTAMVLERFPGDNEVESSPYVLMQSALRQYVETDESAPMYFHKMVIKDETAKKGQSLMIPPAETLVLMPAITFYRKNEERPTDNIQEVEVFLMKKSMFFPIRDRIYELWNQGCDMNATVPAMGKFLLAWNKERTAPIPGLPREDIFCQNGSFGYNMALTDRFPTLHTSYDGRVAKVTQSQCDAWRRIIRPVTKYVNYMSWEDQAALICKYCPSGPIIYAWRDIHPEWISQDVWRRAKTEKQIVDIGMVYPAAVAPAKEEFVDRAPQQAAPKDEFVDNRPQAAEEEYDTGDAAFPVLPAQSTFGGSFLGDTSNSVQGNGTELDVDSIM